MLRAYRFSSTLLRGVSRDTLFEPVTLPKVSLQIGLSGEKIGGVTGFLLYSKILSEVSSFIRLLSKNKGIYPVTLTSPPVVNRSLQLNFEGVTGCFFDPVTGGETNERKSTSDTKDFRRSRFSQLCTSRELPETLKSQKSLSKRTVKERSKVDYPVSILYYSGTGDDKMSDEKDKKRAVSYTRVSTREQSEDGESLGNQKDRIEAYCKAKNYDLVGSFTDAGASAKDLDRDGLQSLIREIKADSIDVVIIYKLDRLTRSVKDLGRLIDDIFGSEGVALASVKDSFDTTTANGRMVMNLLATVAQWERETVAERTKDALQHKRDKGEWTGRVPFGFRINGEGELEEDPEEIKKIQKIKRAKNRGRSYRQIAETYDVSLSLAHKLVNTNLRTLKAEYGVD